MASKPRRNRLTTPRELVETILLSNQRLDSEQFLWLVQEPYQEAIQQRDQHWIREFQRECAMFALTEDEVLRFLPNPYGRNFKAATKKRPSSTETRPDLHRDIRLQDNPDLTVVRMNAAGTSKVTAAVVTGVPAAETATTDTNQPGPAAVESPMVTASAVTTPSAVPERIADTDRQAEEESPMVTASSVTTPSATHSSQGVVLSSTCATESSLVTASAVTKNPVAGQGSKRTSKARKNESSQALPVETAVYTRSGLQRQHEKEWRPEEKKRRVHTRSPTRRDSRSHQSSYRDSGRPAKRHIPETFKSRVFYSRDPRYQSLGDRRSETHRKEPSRPDGHKSFSNRQVRPKIKESRRLDYEPLPDVSVTVKGSKRTISHTGHGPALEATDGPPCKQARKMCPIKGCNQPIGKLRNHLRKVHIPGLFHDEETPNELKNAQFLALRRHMLEMLARYLKGMSATVYDLIDIVNKEADLPPTEVARENQPAMEAMAREFGWRQPGDQLVPLNTPAQLIHWRPLAFLIGKLAQSQREEIFRLFGERWAVPGQEVMETSMKRNRPNPRRRKKWNEKHQERSDPPEAMETTTTSTPDEGIIPTMTFTSKEALPTIQEVEEVPKDQDPLHSTDGRTMDQTPEVFGPKEPSQVCLKQGAEEVDVSNTSLLKFNLGDLTLNLGQAMELDYGESSVDEETLLQSSDSSPEKIQGTGTESSQASLTYAEVLQGPKERKAPTPPESSGGFSYADAVKVQQKTTPPKVKEQPGNIKNSPIGIAPPRPRAPVVANPSQPEAFDSHFHLDRLSRKLHCPAMDEKIIFHHMDPPPTVPVTLSGGVAVFCDPSGYRHIPKDLSPCWKIAVGVHPTKLADLTPSRRRQLKEFLKDPRVAAFGEIGVDYDEELTDRGRQLAALEELLPLCSTRHVLVLHIRGRGEESTRLAFLDCFEMVSSYVTPEQRIHLHCFTGNHEQRQKWSDAFPNCYFGYTGAAARFRPHQRDAVNRTPLSRLLVETDSPYLTVQPRQRTNTPAYIGDVAYLISGIKKMPVSIILQHTTSNGQSLYAGPQ